MFFVRSTTSGEGDSAAIDLLVGALEELGSIVVFFNEEQFKWHFSVAHFHRFHHIESSSGAILLFHFKLQSHGLNFPFQVFLM